jgi:hypothetical protein
VETNGRLLDESTLGWENAGPPGTVAMLHSKQFIVGDCAPLQRPERYREEASVDEMGNVVVNDIVDMAALSLLQGKPKLSKEEKAAKKKVKKKAKCGGEEETEEQEELREPSKKDIKAAKKRAADRRKAAKDNKDEEDEGGADATTDDELEAAGFMCQ